MIGQIISSAFQLRLMAFAVNINRRDPSNKKRHHLQLKEIKVMLNYLCI